MNINTLDAYKLVKYINSLTTNEAQTVMSKLTDKKLEHVYDEAVTCKTEYKDAYLRLDKEQERRKKEDGE